MKEDLQITIKGEQTEKSLAEAIDDIADSMTVEDILTAIDIIDSLTGGLRALLEESNEAKRGPE